MSIRVTQIADESLVQNTSDIRASQVAVEPLVQNTSNIRVTQVVVEALIPATSSPFTVQALDDPGAAQQRFLVSGGTPGLSVSCTAADPTIVAITSPTTNPIQTASGVTFIVTGRLGGTTTLTFVNGTQSFEVTVKIAANSTSSIVSSTVIHQAVFSVYDPYGNLLEADVSGDVLSYTCEDTPSGSGAGSMKLCLFWEQMIADGYWTARNILEISEKDQVLTAAWAGGSNAAKLYIQSNVVFDPAMGFVDEGMIFLDDGVTLTTRLQVLSIGSDGGGDYINVVSSDGTNIPAYALGSTVGRRIYCGQIARRTTENALLPQVQIDLVGLYNRLNESVGTWAINDYDVGAALYMSIQQLTANFPELSISDGNFPVVGYAYSGSRDRTTLGQMISEIVTAIGGGDLWIVRVGHDRQVKLIKLFDGASATYAYNVNLRQNTNVYEALHVQNADQDTSQQYNVIEVIGDTDPATKQPCRAIVIDQTSIDVYGRIEGAPVSNTSCKTDDMCASYGQSLLLQFSGPRANSSLRLYSYNLDPTQGDVGTDSAGPTYSGYTFTPGTPPTVSGPTTRTKGTYHGTAITGVMNVVVEDFNAPAPNIYGLAMSVQETFEAPFERYQDVQFSAIEPDWSAAMKEKANGLATSLRQNIIPAAYLDQYIVSVSAFAYAESGLTVTWPVFAAQFAKDTSPIELGNNSATMLAQTTNWAWINPDNTWTIKQDPSPVSGAILIAIFQTDATQVIGSFNKAAIGIIDPTKTIGANATNLVVDSGFDAANYNANGIASNDPYWKCQFIDGSSCFFWWDEAIANSAKSFAITHGCPNLCFAISEPIKVSAGAIYNFSGYIDGTQFAGVQGSDGKGCYVGIVDSTGSNTFTQVYAYASQAKGVKGTVDGTWTCPEDGSVTEVCFIMNFNDIGRLSGTPSAVSALICQPFMALGGLQQPYTPGPTSAAGTTASAEFTIATSTNDPSGNYPTLTAGYGIPTGTPESGSVYIQVDGATGNQLWEYNSTDGWYIIGADTAEVTSINGLTGDTSITSVDGSVTITPSGTSIDLHVDIGAGGSGAATSLLVNGDTPGPSFMADGNGQPITVFL